MNIIKKQVYGRTRYYPNCEYSRKLCELTETKTIHEDWIKLLGEMGVNILVVEYSLAV